MTNQERLEKIKEKTHNECFEAEDTANGYMINMVEIPLDDIEWLIKQSERAEEMEQVLGEIKVIAEEADESEELSNIWDVTEKLLRGDSQ